MMECEGLSHLPDTQGNTDTRCFCHLNKDVVPNKSGKSCGRDLKTVMAWRQARNIERSRARTYDLSFFLAGGPVHHGNGCPKHCAALLVRYPTRHCSRCPTLGPGTARGHKAHLGH